MAGESCAPSPQLRGSPRQGKGLKAPPQGLPGPLGTQPTPALGFPWAESERGKAFPVPRPGQMLPALGLCLARAGPSPPHPQRAATASSPCPACPPSSSRLPSKRLITQTGSRLGPNLCPLNSTVGHSWVPDGGHQGPALGTPCGIWERTGVLYWGAGAQHWGMPGSSGVPALGDGGTREHCNPI